MRYFVEFAYEGSRYHGWQNQPNALTVQEVLEHTFATLLKTSVALVGAGRTDAGVHAKQMFAHFDVAKLLDIEDIVYRMNAFLPYDIAVQAISPVHKDAHARFDAVARTYEYWVIQEKNPFHINDAYYLRYALDVERMNQAAELLLSYDDFECFSKSNTDVHTYLCAIKYAKWTRQNGLLVFAITADRFLRNMVRAIVGTLLDVGVGKKTLDDVKAIINSKDRRLAGASVPAKGLYLTEINYPETIKPKHG